jgi:hypothetical protein
MVRSTAGFQNNIQETGARAADILVVVMIKDRASEGPDGPQDATENRTLIC